MTALAATDVTVSIKNRDFVGNKRDILADVSFGDGSLTYPTGGVPMPAVSNFGLYHGVEFVEVEQPPANGFIYKFDRSNHKLKIFTQGFTTGSTATASNEDGALVEDSSGTEATAPRMPKTAVDTTYDMGALIELPSSIAPASVTIRMRVIGR